jgi:gamma-glutamyltranspeptidase/glutathione hydrolase
MIVRSSNGTYEFIDFRETAPAAAFEDMYKNNTQASITGGLASGVPGELRGLQYLHENYGKLPWRTVLSPAAKVAREGWTVNEDLVSYMKSATNNAPENNVTNFLVHDPQFAVDFAPKGRLLRVNETITRKRYAETIEKVACEGPDAFYEGPIAEATIRALQAQNGTMTLEDLKNYTVAIRKPASITYRDYKLTSCSAPSGGNVALAVLKIMEGYSGVGDPENINLTTHRLDESMRFAYGERANLGDPLFLEGIDKYQNQMISEATAKEIRSKIRDNQTFDVSYYNPAGLESIDTPGTSHVVTADYTGLSISLTTTINLLFGSKLIVPETGVIMNNEINVRTPMPSISSIIVTDMSGLLHPQHHKRIRLHPLARKLHPPRKTPPLLHLPRHNRAPQRHVPRIRLLRRHRRRRRLPHHNLHHPEHPAHPRRQEERAGGTRAAAHT